MRKNVILLCIVIFLGVLAFNLNILYADNTPYPKDNPKEDLAPTEVCVYTDVGYLGYEKCWKVKPGQRYVLVNKVPPGFGNKISSIRMGYLTKLFIFRNAYFADNRLFISDDDGDGLADFGEPQIFKTFYLIGNGSQDGCISPVLNENIDPESSIFTKGNRKIKLTIFLKHFTLLIIENIVDHGVYFIIGQWFHVYSSHVPIYPEHGRFTGADVQIGCITFNRKLK